MKASPYFIDDENPEWTKEEFAKAKRGVDFFTKEQLTEFKTLEINKPMAIIIDSDVLEKYKALGAGWQTRINDVLREAKV